MLIRGDGTMSITNYIRDLRLNNFSYKFINQRDLDYLDKFLNFFQENDNLLYPAGSLKILQSYEKEIRKIKLLLRELGAFKVFLEMIHNESQTVTLEEIKRIFEAEGYSESIILKGGAASSQDIQDRGSETPVLNEQSEAQQKKIEVEKTIQKCQEDLSKLLEGYEKRIMEIKGSKFYHVGKLSYRAGMEMGKDINESWQQAKKGYKKKLDEANKKDGFEGLQDRMRYNLTSPTSIERYVREKMGLDQNGIKITLEVFSALGVEDIKDINKLTIEGIEARYKIIFSYKDNNPISDLYRGLDSMEDRLKRIGEEIRGAESDKVGRRSTTRAASADEKLEALIPQQEKLKEDIAAEKINVEKQIEGYVEREYRSKIERLIQASNEEVKKETEKEEERKRKRAEEDEKALQRDKEKEGERKRNRLIGRKGFFETIARNRDSKQVKLADAEGRLKEAQADGSLDDRGKAIIQEEIDSLKKEIADEKKKKKKRKQKKMLKMRQL